jgi:hypothetical protein
VRERERELYHCPDGVGLVFLDTVEMIVCVCVCVCVVCVCACVSVCVCVCVV